MNGYTKEEKKWADWRVDLESSRNLSQAERQGYAFLVSWYEEWRMQAGKGAGRESCVEFWKTRVQSKERTAWQLEQWGEAVRWYLKWLGLAQTAGKDTRTVPERMKEAAISVAARRGLARRTRETYSGWIGRYGTWVNDARRAMDTEEASLFLGYLVEKEKVSYSTQKQALNALVFFFREVCGMEEVRLEVRLRKTEAKGCSYRTEETYAGWCLQYVQHYGKRHPGELGAVEMGGMIT